MDRGQFGLSLSRCPRLETVETYKLRCLGDLNYAVLPSLQSISLYRSECTTHLDILYAPKLTEVSLEAAYDLRGFKLRNIPTATLATVEALLAAKAAAEESAREAVRAEDARWRDRSQVKALTKEARKRGWIERGEKWCVNLEPPAAETETDDDNSSLGQWEDEEHEDILMNQLEKIFRELVDPAAKAAEAKFLGASVADASLPRCAIDVTNMLWRLGSIEPQVRGRCMVQQKSYDVDVTDVTDDDDDDDALLLQRLQSGPF